MQLTNLEETILVRAALNEGSFEPTTEFQQKACEWLAERRLLDRTLWKAWLLTPAGRLRAETLRARYARRVQVVRTTNNAARVLLTWPRMRYRWRRRWA